MKTKNKSSLGRLALTCACLALVAAAEEDKAFSNPFTAMDVIRQEGYLIVQDESSFYYFDRKKTFASGPLNIWQGRTIRGEYAVIAPWSFLATGTVTYVNEPCTPTPHKMKMTVTAVSRESEPFDFKTLYLGACRRNGEQLFPTNPVSHRAHFVFDYLVPVKKEPQ